MAWRRSFSKQTSGRLLLLFALTLMLSGCALQLPGAKTSAPRGRQGVAPVATGTINEFQMNVAGGISQIFFDRTGNLWFAGESSLGWRTPAGDVKKIDVLTRVRHILNVVPGPDGNFWFIGRPQSTRFNESIGYVTPTGQIKEWELSPMGIGFFPTLSELIAGPDGNMWYSRSSGVVSRIGRITPTGSRKEFTVYTGQGLFAGLAVGSDGNFWFSIRQFKEVIDYQRNVGTLLDTGGLIGRVTQAGHVQYVNYPFASSYPTGLVRGTDGNLWFEIITVANGQPAGSASYGIVGRDGKVARAPANAVRDAIKGPDGNLWSIDSAQNAIRRVTATGEVREFKIPTAHAAARDLVVAKDGNLWFAEAQDKIGRVTPSGQVTEFTITSPGALIGDLIVGPDGNLWFNENFAAPGNNDLNRIGDIGRVTI